MFTVFVMELQFKHKKEPLSPVSGSDWFSFQSK